jgi:hypothetical protein
VFNTSELLERIIVHLPMKSIFTVQRVSQKFKAVVDTSPSIQTKVFRRPQNTPAETWVVDDSRELGVRKFDDKAPPTEMPKRAQDLVTPVVLNPLLKLKSCPEYFHESWGWIQSHSDTRSYATLYVDRAAWSRPRSARIDLQQGLLGSDPSFLQMYITDPPNCKACVGIEAEYQLEPDSDAETGTVVGSIIESDDGLTFGDLLHARVNAKLSWEDGTGDFEGVDIDLEEMMETAACPIITEKDSYPICTLILLGVCVPTAKTWATVSAEYQEAS